MREEPILMPRAVHRAGWLLLGGSSQLILSMLIVQAAFPGYSWASNYISDLGNTHLSPLWPLFSVSSVVLGTCVIAGGVEMRASLRPGPARTVGLALLILTGVGAIGVGLNPEDVRQRLHVASAALAFFGGNVCLLVLAIAMLHVHRWRGFRVLTAALGVVGLVAFGFLVTKTYGILGAGGVERLVAWPLFVWAIVVGLHLLRQPTVAPPRPASAAVAPGG